MSRGKFAQEPPISIKRDRFLNKVNPTPISQTPYHLEAKAVFTGYFRCLEIWRLGGSEYECTMFSCCLTKDIVIYLSSLSPSKRRRQPVAGQRKCNTQCCCYQASIPLCFLLNLSCNMTSNMLSICPKELGPHL